MKLNYYRATESLISFKDRLHLILNKKNEAVLTYLKSIELDFENEDDIGVPDITKICEAVNLPRTKVYPILYTAYVTLLETLYNRPHRVENCIHTIYIYSHDEYKDSKNKVFKEREEARTFCAEIRLPVTPRPGETISLDFVQSDIKYFRGVVTEVIHNISPQCQNILIYVHPFRNYYWQWDKLKTEHEFDERWRRSLRNS